MQVTRTGHHYPKKRFKVWRDDVRRQLIQQRCVISSDGTKGYPSLSHASYRNLRCTIRYTPNDKRTRDIPGMEDAIYHCLEQAGVIDNDGQIKHSGGFTTLPQAEEVRLDIEIEEAI